MDQTINILGLDRAAVLAALFNYSTPPNTVFPGGVKPTMSIEEARALIAEFDAREDSRIQMLKSVGRSTLRIPPSFDYIQHRPVRVRMDNQMSVVDYDKDLGPGSARKALQQAGLIPL